MEHICQFTNERSKSYADRVEVLNGSIDPNLSRSQFGPIWFYVELDSVHGPGQSQAADEKRRQYEVRENRSEIHDLRK